MWGGERHKKTEYLPIRICRLEMYTLFNSIHDFDNKHIVT